jgi:hypothetical protein
MAKRYFAGKLKPKFKAKWVKALRSGKYKQGQAALNPTEGHYCCLGVACVVNGNALTKEVRFGLLKPEHTKLGLPLPHEAREWWEVLPYPETRLDSPCVRIGKRWRRLTELNDDVQGYDFNKIADLIEEQL